MIFLLLGLTLHASETTPFCQWLLEPNQSSREFLQQPWLAQLGESLARNQPDAHKNYADQIRIVTDELVQQNRITPMQAETVFAEHLLGRFSAVFLKYTLAELVDRDFDAVAITRFIQNFDRAYSPARQVEFAIAVTRRMLLTLNDDPSASSARGIHQFVESARMFDLSEYDYGQFLQLWTFLRDSQVQTIVRFILANILNTSRNVETDVRSRLAEQLTLPAEVTSAWTFRLRRPLPRSVTTFDGLFTAALDLKNISPSLVKVRGIVQAQHQALFLDRFLNQSDQLPKTAKAYFADLESRPPFARDQIMTLDLDHMDYALLRQISFTRDFARFSEAARARAHETLAAFGQLEILVKRLRQLARHHESPAAQDNEILVAGFLSAFEVGTRGRLDQSNQETKQIANQILNSVYDQFRSEFPGQLTTSDFMSIASGLINRVFVLGFFSPDIGLATGLLGMSRDFELTNDQVKSLIHLMDGFRAYRYRDNKQVENSPLNKYGEFNEIFDVSRWGRKSQKSAPRQPASGIPSSDEITALLKEIQLFLIGHEDDRPSLNELLQLLRTSEPT